MDNIDVEHLSYVHDHMEAEGVIEGSDFWVVALLEETDDMGL